MVNGETVNKEIEKYSLEEIQRRIERAKESIGKVECTHQVNIARAMMEFNQMIDQQHYMTVNERRSRT